jgi:NAD(P)-dependent dehydrogenase (short-subunit alcohol dehydrogenase family)
MSFRIQGSVALVTGANRGIGRALVAALLERGAARVYAGARRVSELDSLVAGSGGRVVPLQLDVTSAEHIRAAAARAGDVALLVNNAGIARKIGGEFTDADWLDHLREEFEVNAIAPLAVTQSFAPILKANGGGAIVNVSSVAGLTAFPAFVSYSASKSAVHSITQSTRALLAGQGTFVAGVYPGPIETGMSEKLTVAKTPASEGASAILDGLEAGEEDILPDVVSRQIGDTYFRSPKALERQVGGLRPAM